MRGHKTHKGVVVIDEGKYRPIISIPGKRVGRKTMPDQVTECYEELLTPSGAKLLRVGVNYFTKKQCELIDKGPPPIRVKHNLNINLDEGQSIVVEEIKEQFRSQDPRDKGVVLKLAAGNGKTYIAGKLIQTLGMKTLIVTPAVMSATAGWKKMIPDICEYSGTTKQDGNIVIMMINSATNDEFVFDDVTYTAEDYFSQFGLIVLDECHNFTSEKRSKILRTGCFKYRLAMSATPELAKYEQMLYWYVGPLMDADVYFVSNVEWKGTVRAIKYSGNPEHTVIETINRDPTSGIHTGKTIKRLLFDDDRHSLVLREATELHNMDMNVIIFAEHKEYCRRLAEDLAHLGAFLLIGGSDDQMLLEANTRKIIICTYGYASEALSLPHADAEILATPRRSRMLQILPRVMRKGGDANIRRIYVDIVDTNIDTFRNQFTHRCRAYSHFKFDIVYIKEQWTEKKHGITQES